MMAPSNETRIPILSAVKEGQQADCAVVRYRRKKWPRMPREEGFHFLASDGEEAEEVAVVRAEFWARVTLPIRYPDAFDIRIVLERRSS